MKNIWVEGIMGVVIGDALGTPVQFMCRAELIKRPVTQMEGYGTYNMPPGTWSDDSSMTLATLDSIQKCNDVDYKDIMDRFVKWMYEGEYTPYGEAFDEGNTCSEAIQNYFLQHDYVRCGKTGEWANGNGALMRIMPVCLYAYEKVKKKEWKMKEAIECIQQVSALTHNHLRSKLACGMYFFMVRSILDEQGDLMIRLQKGIDEAKRFYQEDIHNLVELSHYARLFSLDSFLECNVDEINSSGYVVDSLEAAIWSLITTTTFEEVLLRAVNLGDDTDTVGAIAGGLAGLFYGYESFPKAWLSVIQKRDWIMQLCEQKILKSDLA